MVTLPSGVPCGKTAPLREETFYYLDEMGDWTGRLLSDEGNGTASATFACEKPRHERFGGLGAVYRICSRCARRIGIIW